MKIKKYEEMNENISLTKTQLLELLQENLNIVISEEGETIKVSIYFDEKYISSDEFSIQGYL